MQTHAANPFAEPLTGDNIRVYFTSRDIENRSNISFLDMNLKTLSIVQVSDRPLLTPGALGTFDDSGTALGWILNHEREKWFYYLGWNLGVTVPWRNSLGLAIMHEGSEILERYSQAPLLDRHPIDPFSISYPCVRYEDGHFRIWYGSNLSWGPRSEDMAHVIKYAESLDGYLWRREGTIAIQLTDNEYALSKPCVLKDGDIYKMWYSYRGAAYRIGYAESRDGISWIRMDEKVGIDVSPSGWDSEMICYAHVFDHNGSRYMLYNGNRYGLTGFGLAVLENQ